MKSIFRYNKLTSKTGWVFFLGEPAPELIVGESTPHKARGKFTLTPHTKCVGVSFCLLKRGAL